jgi:excisionase family DNA binding protein
MFWTVEQAADFLKTTRYHVDYLIAMGKLAAIRIGSKLWRIAPGDVKKYTKQLPISSDCQKKIIESFPAILSAQDMAVCFHIKRKLFII